MEQNPVQEQLGQRRVLDYGSLDAWRGLACLAVVLFHCSVEMGLRMKVRPANFAWAVYGQLGVQVFFVISGFCIAVAAHSSWHKRSWGKFAWARLTRIYPPLWVAIVLALAMKIIGAKINSQMVQNSAAGEGPLFYVSNFLLLNEYPPFAQPYLLRVAWSLCYEVAFYGIMFLALIGTAKAKSANSMLNVLHALSLGVLVWLICVFDGAPWLPFPLDLWPQFGVGILVFDLLLAKAQKEEKREKFLWAVGLAFATLGIVFLARCWFSPRLNYRTLPFAVSFGFAAIMWFAYRFEGNVSRWNFVKLLHSIGTFSYSIYLVHFTLIMALSRALFSRVKFLPWFVEVIVQVLFSVVSGWIFYRMVEKPSQKLKRVRK
ncbi:acyltransferase [bacterium]|nr:MAG: acyltransferase [bacterium]